MPTKYIKARRCTLCNVLKPLTEYGRVESKGPGKREERRCKECLKNRQRERRKSPERRAAQAAYGKQWREKNPDYARQYREENREHLNELQRRHRQAHPEYYRERRLARLGLGDGLIWDMYEDQRGLCAYCEVPLFANFHIDHMLPVSRNGESRWENYALACPACNLSKGKKTAEEFMEYLMPRS